MLTVSGKNVALSIHTEVTWEEASLGALGDILGQRMGKCSLDLVLGGGNEERRSHQVLGVRCWRDVLGHVV